MKYFQNTHMAGMLPAPFKGRSDLPIYNQSAELILNMDITKAGGLRTRNPWANTDCYISYPGDIGPYGFCPSPAQVINPTNQFVYLFEVSGFIVRVLFTIVKDTVNYPNLYIVHAVNGGPYNQNASVGMRPYTNGEAICAVIKVDDLDRFKNINPKFIYIGRTSEFDIGTPTSQIVGTDLYLTVMFGVVFVVRAYFLRTVYNGVVQSTNLILDFHSTMVADYDGNVSHSYLIKEVADIAISSGRIILIYKDGEILASTTKDKLKWRWGTTDKYVLFFNKTAIADPSVGGSYGGGGIKFKPNVGYSPLWMEPFENGVLIGAKNGVYYLLFNAVSPANSEFKPLTSVGCTQYTTIVDSEDTGSTLICFVSNTKSVWSIDSRTLEIKEVVNLIDYNDYIPLDGQIIGLANGVFAGVKNICILYTMVSLPTAASVKRIAGTIDEFTSFAMFSDKLNRTVLTKGFTDTYFTNDNNIGQFTSGTSDGHSKDGYSPVIIKVAIATSAVTLCTLPAQGAEKATFGYDNSKDPAPFIDSQFVSSKYISNSLKMFSAKNIHTINTGAFINPKNELDYDGFATLHDGIVVAGYVYSNTNIAVTFALADGAVAPIANGTLQNQSPQNNFYEYTIAFLQDANGIRNSFIKSMIYALVVSNPIDLNLQSGITSFSEKSIGRFFAKTSRTKSLLVGISEKRLTSSKNLSIQKMDGGTYTTYVNATNYRDYTIDISREGVASTMHKSDEYEVDLALDLHRSTARTIRLFLSSHPDIRSTENDDMERGGIEINLWGIDVTPSEL